MILSAVVLALTLQAASHTPAPVCSEDKPIAAIAVSDGGPRTVLVAVWDDGRIIRALSEKDPGLGYAQAQLSPSVMEEVRATLLRMRYWKWSPSNSGGDAKLQMTMACVESHPASFEHKGKPSVTTGAGQLRDYLMRLRLPSPIRADAPLPDVWLPWFRDGGGTPIPVPQP